jgi:hypothetical protein
MNAISFHDTLPGFGDQYWQHDSNPVLLLKSKVLVKHPKSV